jgi:hypothetical protein
MVGWQEGPRRPRLSIAMISANLTTPYEAPEITVIGSVYELTQYCDKHLNGSDGFTFMGQQITCVS